jgi:protein-disulfide isomerase
VSRKSERNRKPTSTVHADTASAKRKSRVTTVVVAAALIAAGLAGAYWLQRTPSPSSADTQASALLASEDSPTRGNPAAKVHIVEFLDPACETCAQFFPLVERVMADNPDKIRLTVRHVAFHDGSEFAVRVLEASRRQDKYWETLAQLFATQQQWAPRHVAQPDLILQSVTAVGMDQQQLQQDLNAPEVTERIARDLSAAMVMKVTATPEYFVNGRPLPSFGDTQLLDLIAQELKSAY